MNIPENCRESFLDGVTDVFVYIKDNVSFPVPFCVAQILSMAGCTLKTAALHIATSDENEYVSAESIQAKATPEQGGNGTVFTHEITVSVSKGIENVREVHKNLAGKQCYVVLRTADGQLNLCYTCPGSFVFTPATTTSQTERSQSLTITLKSMSDFIPITLVS